ncbi:MAG TPA: aminoacetone oxidase family FAD-binding enzyme [Candidatus Polarisedimenticolia bacterium]|nr:aminoacetone oxidase family FAD-binding enzyme [Candidatus Polarisedimenticolia bacterium]
MSRSELDAAPGAVDLAVIGAGAAGLMAAIWAGRSVAGRTIVVLDSAVKPGAKILIAGGGRCNVTHDVVDETAFAGSSRPAIRKVLRRFSVPQTIAFFREIGVRLKREETGKLFPTTDSGRTVLNALLAAAGEAGVLVRHPCRVEAIVPEGDAFLVVGPSTGAARWGHLRAKHVILATGGRSLPKSGSDGHGFAIAESLGHSLTPRIFPALVPLTLPPTTFIPALSGVSANATVRVRAASGGKTVAFTDSLLCAHFGVTGPAVLDLSRYYIDAVLRDGSARLEVNWLPGATRETFDEQLRRLKQRTPAAVLGERLPDRLSRALCAQAGVDPSVPGHRLPKDQRRRLSSLVTGMELPITGHRGYTHAEVTAGGVPLGEIHLDSMRSRVRPGLSLCGEICDVDGRIGGFNFQWAWASGYVAGVGIGR